MTDYSGRGRQAFLNWLGVGDQDFNLVGRILSVDGAKIIASSPRTYEINTELPMAEIVGRLKDSGVSILYQTDLLLVLNTTDTRNFYNVKLVRK